MGTSASYFVHVEPLTGGYTCASCGGWVDWNAAHYCQPISFQTFNYETYVTVSGSRLRKLEADERKLAEIKRILEGT